MVLHGSSWFYILKRSFKTAAMKCWLKCNGSSGSGRRQAQCLSRGAVPAVPSTDMTDIIGYHIDMYHCTLW